MRGGWEWGRLRLGTQEGIPLLHVILCLGLFGQKPAMSMTVPTAIPCLARLVPG